LALDRSPLDPDLGQDQDLTHSLWITPLGTAHAQDPAQAHAQVRAQAFSQEVEPRPRPAVNARTRGKLGRGRDEEGARLGRMDQGGLQGVDQDQGVGVDHRFFLSLPGTAQPSKC
jgi:hypothetical protein